jgi:hypothetical protein
MSDKVRGAVAAKKRERGRAKRRPIGCDRRTRKASAQPDGAGRRDENKAWGEIWTGVQEMVEEVEVVQVAVEDA